MKTYSEMVELLKGVSSCTILTHNHPDGDTIGCAAALCSALRRLGKTAYVFPNREITDKFLPLIEAFYLPDGVRTETVISVDTASAQMLAEGFSGDVDLCIDHHGSNTGYARAFYFDASKAACGEIIADMILTLCGAITKEEADALYVAVSTDTGCFCYANTTPQTLRCAAMLIEAGADHAHLNKLHFRSFSFSRLKLEGLIFSTMRVYDGGQVNIAVITKKMLEEAGVTENDCDDLAALPGKIEGSVVSVTIKETPEGTSKVSVRTNETVNANAICAVYGGGGHAMASGCRIKATPDQAADMILKTVREIRG